MSIYVDVTLHCSAHRCTHEAPGLAELVEGRHGVMQVTMPVLPPGWTTGHFDRTKTYCPSHPAPRPG